MAANVVDTARRAEVARAAQRRAVGVLSLSQVVGGVGIGSALALGGVLAEELSGSAAWAGTATTMVTLGAALFALPLAGAAARRGRRTALALGWFVAMAGSAVVLAGAYLGVFPVFLLGMALFGSGIAASLQSRYAAADLAADRTRARDLSLVVWATTVGSVAGPNLVGAGAVVGIRLGLPETAGAFVFATVAFAMAGVLTVLALRPDPLLLARELAGAAAPTRRGVPLRAAATAIAASPHATLAAAGIALSHGVMIMVMTMTPVHMHHGGAALTLVGLTISLHIAGMYALSPLVGWLADRVGRVGVLLAGQGVLVAAAVLSAAGGHGGPLLTAGLVLLGVGWSFGVVAGSALLTESVADPDKPGVQGASDLLMNLVGAGCGALSGVLLSLLGFTGLNVVAAALTVPVVLLALRAARSPR